jgi:superfamily II DNA helicase RecQ
MSDSEDEDIYSTGENAVVCDLIRQTGEMDHIKTKLQSLFGYTGKDIQVSVVRQLVYDRKDVILVAKTGFGKSLIFQAAPLILEGIHQICLIVMPLKAIQEEQHAILSTVPGAYPIVLNGENNSKETRIDVASGKYTHGK